MEGNIRIVKSFKKLVLPPARLWAESRLAEPLARASRANIAAHGSGDYGSNG